MCNKDSEDSLGRINSPGEKITENRSGNRTCESHRQFLYSTLSVGSRVPLGD